MDSKLIQPGMKAIIRKPEDLSEWPTWNDYSINNMDPYDGKTITVRDIKRSYNGERYIDYCPWTFNVKWLEPIK